MSDEIENKAQGLDDFAEQEDETVVLEVSEALKAGATDAFEVVAARATEGVERVAANFEKAAANITAQLDSENPVAKAATAATESAARVTENVTALVDEVLEARRPQPIEPDEDAAEDFGDKPKVSIIVPFYNAASTLHRTLVSIRMQTYRNLEIIVIDDGSTDGGELEALRVAELDSRVHLIRKANTGVSGTRNVGLDAAKGDWVFFCDADDWLAPDAIESFVECAQHYGSDFVIADFYRVAKGLIAYKHGPATGLFGTSQFLRYMGRRPANHYFSSLWNKLFKREIIEKAGLRFDTKINFGEDHVFILNYLRFVETVALVDKPLYYYIDREDSLVHKGLNVFGVVKMKWDTYRPYLRLFNDKGLYPGLQRPRVYKYIFMPAMDHFVDKGDAPFDPDALFSEAMRTLEEGDAHAT